MILNRSRLRGARLLVALGCAGFISASPVRADIPVNLIETIEALQDPVEQEPETAEEAKHLGEGEASYYGAELAGNRTASGERFNPRALTAAHRSLPLGSRLRVTNKANGKSVVVRINDRGPFARSRLIDVSLAAAQEIGMIRAGKARVRLELLS